MAASIDRSEDLSFLLMNQAGDILLAVDPATLCIAAANETACRRLGYPRSQLIGMRIVDLDFTLAAGIFWHGIDAHSWPEIDRSETEFRRCDDGCIEVDRTVCPVDHMGQHYLLVSARDIADLRMLERKLDDATGRLRSILESTADGILALNLNGQVVGMNHAFAAMWQIPDAPLDAGNEAMLQHMVHAAKDGPAVGKLLDPDAFAGDTARILTVEIGERRTLKLTSNPLVVANAVAGRVYSCSDITELTRYEVQLARQNEILETTVASRTAELAAAEAGIRLILESTADGLIGLNGSGLITFINCAASEMLGHRSEDLMGKNVHDAIHRLHPDGCHYPADECRLVRAIRDGQSVRDDAEIFWRADGSPLPVSVAVHPTGAGADSVGAVMSFSDSTLRHETEKARVATLAEAERLGRAKSEFLANMSHELRTPLNGVLGLARIGARDSVGRSSHETFVRIQDSGTHLLGVINAILDFSKIDAGKLAVEQRPFALTAAIDNAVSFVSGAAREKGLAVEMSVAADLPQWVSGDAQRLQQILANLLSNAVKFTERGEVRLRVASEGGDIYFKVIDTGIGMTEDQATRLFQPFEQADSSTTRKYGGTGLGLAISRSLARLMGGEIMVDCAPGAGCSFTLQLPLPEADAHLPAHVVDPAAPAEKRLAGLRLLAAEDVEINRLILEDLLLHEGAQVIFAEDGQQTLDRLEETGVSAFDAVLMDVQMPVMNGLDATRRLRQIAPALPVIGLTAHAFAEERDKCLAAGMAEHVTKPIDADLLVAAILRQARPDGPIPLLTAARPTAGFAQPAGCDGATHASRIPASPPLKGEEPDSLPFKGRVGEGMELASSAPMTAVPPAPTLPSGLIDWTGLQARYPGREAFVTRLAAIALDSQQEMPAMLHAAAAQQDLETLAFLAHSLKGSAGNLMAPGVQDLAARTEIAAKNGGPRAAELATELANSVAALLDELATRVREDRGNPVP